MNSTASLSKINAAASAPETDRGLRERAFDGRYVLMTAAHNEEENIAKTIQSILAQTCRPERWVIVSDGSQDATDRIVQGYANQHEFIRFIKVERVPGRSFGSKVLALRNAAGGFQDVEFQFIGNLDADITLEPAYFEKLLHCFEVNAGLGIAGGFVYEKTGSEFRSRRSNRSYSVAHAAQLVRRTCYEAFGGYVVLEYGGEDWHAQTAARMKGWEAKSFPELPVFHHRRTGEADNLVRHKFRQGRMDYALGSDPVFETLKCLERIPERPLLIGGLARLAGFSWSWIRRERRPVSNEFVSFLRGEQRDKLKTIFNGRVAHVARSR